MAEINAKDVMKLRNDTGLPMMACKKALEETSGDFEAAKDLLRKQLKGKMDTRADRPAGEGRIGVAIARGAGAIVELRAETDFTAKNEKFVSATEKAAQVALGLPAGGISANEEITAAVDEIRISTGENASYARGMKLEGGTFGAYVHHDGKTGVLLQVDGEAGEETLRQVCMHIAAAHPRPVGVTSDDIPADIVEKERKFRIEQAMESGKPQEIAEKMVEGGMRKFFSEIALIEQDFVMDPSRKIKDVLAPAKAVKFLRWAVGEEASVPAGAAQ